MSDLEKKAKKITEIPLFDEEGFSLEEVKWVQLETAQNRIEKCEKAYDGVLTQNLKL